MVNCGSLQHLLLCFQGIHYKCNYTQCCWFKITLGTICFFFLLFPLYIITYYQTPEQGKFQIASRVKLNYNTYMYVQGPVVLGECSTKQSEVRTRKSLRPKVIVSRYSPKLATVYKVLKEDY